MAFEDYMPDLRKTILNNFYNDTSNTGKSDQVFPTGPANEYGSSGMLTGGVRQALFLNHLLRSQLAPPPEEPAAAPPPPPPAAPPPPPKTYYLPIYGGPGSGSNGKGQSITGMAPFSEKYLDILAPYVNAEGKGSMTIGNGYYIRPPKQYTYDRDRLLSGGYLD